MLLTNVTNIVTVCVCLPIHTYIQIDRHTDNRQTDKLYIKYYNNNFKTFHRKKKNTQMLGRNSVIHSLIHLSFIFSPNYPDTAHPPIF